MPGVVHVPLPYRYRDILLPHTVDLIDMQYMAHNLSYLGEDHTI